MRYITYKITKKVGQMASGRKRWMRGNVLKEIALCR